jgi:hypothetical protein
MNETTKNMLKGVTRIANTKASEYVVERKPFHGSNLFGVFTLLDADQEVYVVYSFDTHYPMYIHTNGAWFENEDRYSRTTSKHLSQARPSSTTVKLSTRWMQRLANNGYQGIAKERVLTTEVL